MTMYFPLVVHGAMLIEPTKTWKVKANSTSSSPRFVSIAERSKGGRRGARQGRAPFTRPRRRLDETLAARKPVLAYRTPAPDGADNARGANIGGG